MQTLSDRQFPAETSSKPKSISSRLIGLARSTDFRIVALLTALSVATRVMAIPASFREWDEILFARALRDFDVARHSPHPPGFPVFVAMGKIAYALTGDEFRALVSVSFVFASLLGAALFYFYLEVFRDRAIAFAAALLCCFFPSVWVYSLSPRSDTPDFVLGLIGLTLVLRGLESSRALVAGCALLGLAMGVRITLLPAMGVVTAIVLLARLRRGEWRLVSLAILSAGVGVALWFAPMIIHQTWRSYSAAVRDHRQFLFYSDSILGGGLHSSVLYRGRRLFADIWGDRWIMWTIYALSALGLLALSPARRRQWPSRALICPALIWMMAAFVPYIVFTFLLNNPMQTVFYSLPFMPLFSGLAAAGLIITSRRLFRPRRWPRLTHTGMLLAIGLTVGIAEWAYPMVRMLHREASPSYRVFQYLRQKLDPRRDVLHYNILFDPHVTFFLPDFRKLQEEPINFPEHNLINPLLERNYYALTREPIMGADNVSFYWKPSRGLRRIRKMSLERYFEAYVADLRGRGKTAFLSGWYGVEYAGDIYWQWAGRSGSVALLNEVAEMELRLSGAVITLPNGGHPAVTMRLDGRELMRFTPGSGKFERTLKVKTEPGRMWSILTIESDQTASPQQLGINGDERQLGFKCFLLHWSPASGAAPVKLTGNQFIGDGWYPLEQSDRNCWRWTSERALIQLPAIEVDAQLNISLRVPEQPDGARAMVTITLADQTLDRFFPPRGEFSKTYQVPAALHRGARADLALSISDLVTAPDSRRLGMQVFKIGWKPLQAR